MPLLGHLANALQKKACISRGVHRRVRVLMDYVIMESIEAHCVAGYGRPSGALHSRRRFLQFQRTKAGWTSLARHHNRLGSTEGAQQYSGGFRRSASVIGPLPHRSPLSHPRPLSGVTSPQLTS
jgi:hypothetical protein